MHNFSNVNNVKQLYLHSNRYNNDNDDDDDDDSFFQDWAKVEILNTLKYTLNITTKY